MLAVAALGSIAAAPIACTHDYSSIDIRGAVAGGAPSTTTASGGDAGGSAGDGATGGRGGGGGSSTSASSSSSSSRGSASSAGGGGSAGGGSGGAAPQPTVDCPPDTCAPGQICCIAKQVPPTQQTCSTAAACNGPSIVAACDGPEDCAPDEVCCGKWNDVAAEYLAVVCQAGTCNRPDRPICHFPNGTCPGGMPVCTISAWLPDGYGWCE